MVQLSYPGVYVEEIPSGVRPIEGVSTSTAAFIGVAERGPVNEAKKKITSWTEFEKEYGSFYKCHYLAHAVYQFFNNGGRQCYIVRVVKGEAKTASITIKNRAANNPPKGLIISAKSPGEWGNYLHLVIKDGSEDPNNTFRIEVRKTEEVKEVPDVQRVIPLEVYDNLNMDPDESAFVEKVLSSSNLISAKVHEDNKTEKAAAHMGGLNPASSLPPEGRNLKINVNGDGYQEIKLKDPCGNLAEIAKAIESEVQKLSPLKASTNRDAFSKFECKVEANGEDKKLVLSSGVAGPKSLVKIANALKDNATSYLKLGLSNGGSDIYWHAVRRPANGEEYEVGDSEIDGNVADRTEGKADDPDGDPPYINGLRCLDKKDDVNLICIPGIPTVVDAGLNYCRNRVLQDCFFIGDMDCDTDTPDEAKEDRDKIATPNSYGAIYFPWLKATDPTGASSEPKDFPPSGFVAGMYAQIDAKRGVWKAPAGTEIAIGGAKGLKINLTDVQQGDLNRKAINCLRQFPGAGIVIWGARTLSSDPEWKYIPVRRMAIFLRVSIYYGIQWAVFEPNDEELWASLRLNINAFMMRLFREGAFQGSTPQDAFFVKCDKETTTQADIDVGVVNIMVGFAPLKPAEFVVVKITQKAGQQS